MRKTKTRFKQTDVGPIPDDWEVRSFSEIVEITSSKRIFMNEYQDSGVPFFRGKEIVEKAAGNDVSTPLFISEERFKEIVDKFGAPSQDDILLSSVGTLGVPYLVKERDHFYFKDGNLVWFRNMVPEVNPKFVYYWLKSPLGQQSILASAIGSTQPALTIDGLKKNKIPFPPLPKQCSIASILSSLDDKIELNRKMNTTLESIAQAIFKHWFVDFEFPNEKGMPYRSSGGKMVDSELGRIPKGWKAGCLGQVAQIVDCLHSRKPSKGTGSNLLLQVYNIDDAGCLDLSDPYHVSNDDYKKWIKRIELRGGDLIISKTGRVGAVAQIPGGFKSGIGRNLVAIRAINGQMNPEYLKELMLSDFMKKEINSKTHSGTILLSLHVKEVEKLSFLIPESHLLNKFALIIKPVHRAIQRNIQEKSILIKIRDSLLPRLMSGRVR